VYTIGTRTHEHTWMCARNHLTSACAVVEVDVGDLHPLGEGGRVHCKVVVLGADLDSA